MAENVYTYDTAGDRLTNQLTLNGDIRTETYGYDELSRLTSVNYGDGGTQTYSFDNMGNRLTKNDSGSGNESYGYNAANMLLTRGTNSYSNDPDGNTLTGGGRTNTWDSQNRLVNCVYGSNTSSYVYGADGFRHRSTVNGTTTDFALDGQFFVRELQGGTPFATYLTGPTGPLYRRDATGATLRWYVYDGLGSVLGEVDASGNLDATRTYDVYGLARSSTGTVTSKHGFVGALGHTSEDETGLVYMRARYMDPAVGRFVSEDPGRNGGNWFSYTDANPITRADEDGRHWWDLPPGAISLAYLEAWVEAYLPYAKILTEDLIQRGKTLVGKGSVELSEEELDELLDNAVGADFKAISGTNAVIGGVASIVLGIELQSVIDYVESGVDDDGSNPRTC